MLALHLDAYNMDVDYGSTVRVVYYSRQWDIVYALGSNRNPLSVLQSLKIYGWLCCKNELMSLFDEATAAWLSASLRHLRFILLGMTTLDDMESL